MSGVSPCYPLCRPPHCPALAVTSSAPASLPTEGTPLRVLVLLSWLLMCLPARLRWSGDCMTRSRGEPETTVIRAVMSREGLRRQGRGRPSLECQGLICRQIVEITPELVRLFLYARNPLNPGCNSEHYLPSISMSFRSGRCDLVSMLEAWGALALTPPRPPLWAKEQKRQKSSPKSLERKMLSFPPSHSHQLLMTNDHHTRPFLPDCDSSLRTWILYQALPVFTLTLTHQT